MNFFRLALFGVFLLLVVLLVPLVAGEQGQLIHAVEGAKEVVNGEVVEEPSPVDEPANNEAVEEKPYPIPPEKQEEEALFPRNMTVLNASEITAVNIRERPTADSKSIGIVYGNLMHVDVIQNLDNGYSEISTWDYASMKDIVGFVPTELLKTVELNEKYGVVVNLSQQKVYIYEDNVLVKTFACSSGLDENYYYTPKGLYRIGERGDSFLSPKYGQGAYHWVRFNNNYLFHSVPFDANRNIIEEEAAKLGQKASHGCIRLSLDDALWFYNNIPKGTPVLIKD